MIGGIFETIGKTLGIGKEKYFLELDDAAEDAAVQVKQSATKAAKTAVKTAKGVSSEIVDKVESVVSDTDEAVDEAAEQAKSTAKAGKAKAKQVAAKADEKAAKMDKKAANAAKGAAPGEQNEAVEKAAAPTQPAVRDPEDLIRAAIAATEKKPGGEKAAPEDAQNFSPDYLMPLGNRGRRRPGPSFSDYKGMAKEVNPRLKG